MTYSEFLRHICDAGIKAAFFDYIHDAHKLEGAVEGFNLCRDKTPAEIQLQLAIEERVRMRLYRESDSHNEEHLKGYWRQACKTEGVRWVLNCIGAFQMIHGMPQTYSMVTARAYMLACSILVPQA